MRTFLAMQLLQGKGKAKAHAWAYFFLCLFFLKRFFLLWVAILCLFLFFPQGIMLTV
jgi:uncharacterized membrane protein